MTKREEVTKQVSVKYSEENSVLWEVSYLNVFTQVGGVGVNAYLSLIEKGRGGRLFEAGRLLTFSTFRMGAYSRWALIRGWALIRINTVDPKATFEPAQAYYGFLLFFSSLCIRSPQLTHRRENRDITKLRRRRQRECLKHKRFRKHNNNSLSTCITPFCKFLCRSCTPKT